MRFNEIDALAYLISLPITMVTDNTTSSVVEMEISDKPDDDTLTLTNVLFDLL